MATATRLWAQVLDLRTIRGVVAKRCELRTRGRLAVERESRVGKITKETRAACPACDWAQVGDLAEQLGVRGAKLR